MLFNFHFFPFPELVTETLLLRESTEEDRQIRWYDLTDGWYWIDVGKTHLFRYTTQAAEQIRSSRFAHGLYVDYYVARLWTDVLDLLPAILEPLPIPLIQRLSSLSDWNNWINARDTWNTARPEATDEKRIEEETELYRTAADWWYERALDTGYLISRPLIWFWSDGVRIHIGWDNRDCLLNGVPIWEAQIGQISLPIADFLADVTAFNHQFITTMAKRVAAAQDYWTDPHFAQDLVSLQQGHIQQATLLEKTFYEVRHKIPTDWTSVLSSIASIEKDSQFMRILKGKGME